MSFDDLMASLNDACLATFGHDLTFSRVASLPDNEQSDETSVSGVLEPGADLEGLPPGDGSTYARFWIESSAISPAAQAGDEISTDSTVYKIVQIQEDAGGGVLFLLRMDRAVT